MSSYMVYECLMILKRLITINPSNRGLLGKVMKGGWLNLGQEETLRPCIDPSCDNMDPCVTKKIMKMGFEWDHIQDSMTHKLRQTDSHLPDSQHQQTQGEGLHHHSRSFCCLDLNSPRPSSTLKFQP